MLQAAKSSQNPTEMKRYLYESLKVGLLTELCILCLTVSFKPSHATSFLSFLFLYALTYIFFSGHIGSVMS